MLWHHCKRHNRLTHRRRHVAHEPPYQIEIYKKSQQQQQQQYHLKYANNSNSLYVLTQILQYNQRFNQRLTFNLELYHKNILKKSSIIKNTLRKLKSKQKRFTNERQLQIKIL